MKRTDLKLFRIRHGLTQEQMAEKLGYSRGCYIRVESGKLSISLRFLTALSTEFGISIDEAREITLTDDDKKTAN